MERKTTIWLHAEAPEKPVVGEPCNGCGVCCASEPCPLGMLVTLSRRGRCRALTWDAPGQRYRCSLLPSREPAHADLTRWAALSARLVRRWIGAGVGCDSTAKVEPH